MGVPSFIQPSFAKGELGPALYGRVDIAAYSVGLRTARNVVIHATGGVSNRPGLKFICPCKDHANRPILIDFQFKATDTYQLEFGNLYMRVIRNDAQVLETEQNITDVTDVSDNATITISGHGYSDGDHVFIASVGGSVELNARWFIVSSKTANTFELTDPYDGSTVIAFADLTTYTSGGTAGKVFELVTTYAQADLPQLKWTQSADVLTLTHTTYTQREVTRTGHNAWTIADITFAPSISAPTALTMDTVNTPDNDIYWKYTVTAVSSNGEESLPALAASKALASPYAAVAGGVVTVTVTSHGLATGDEIELSGLSTMTEVNGRRFIITSVNANSFTLNDEDGTDYTDEDTGGSAFPAFVGTGTLAAPTGQRMTDNTISWTASTDAVRYFIYRQKHGAGGFGFLQETIEITYHDRTDDSVSVIGRRETDPDILPPTEHNPFRTAGQFPGAVGYYQQRRVFGGSVDDPDTSEYSQTGNQVNYSKGGVADQAITATLNSRKVNQIRHYVPGKDLMILTDGSEWRVNSGDNSGFSAETLKQEPQTTWGSSHLPPISVGPTILYVQENLTVIRSLSYALRSDAYSGSNMTLLAPHIFDETTAVSWSFARSPDPLFHVVRADGTVGVMTFDEEQEVLAWARWDTLGDFKWCSAMRPSSTETNDAAYFVVERIINGNTVLFIERVASRRFSDIQDAYFVDCGLTLDSPSTISGSTAADPVVVSATSHGFSDGDEVDIEGVTWTTSFDSDDNATNPDQLNGRRYIVVDKNANDFTLVKNSSNIHITAITKADPGVVTAPAHGLSDGNIIAINSAGAMTEVNNNIYKVASKTTDTFELNTVGDANVDTSGFTTYTGGGNVYHAEDGSAFAAYVKGGNARVAVLTVSGVDHLEGESIAILANGSVVTGKSVSGGSVTLDEKASRVHLGLKIISDIETLNVEASDRTLQGRFTKIPNVVVRVQKSRGFLIGPSSDRLVATKEREFETMGEPSALLTGDRETILKPDWNSNGRVFIRQNSPIPLTVLAIIPRIKG